MDIKILIHWDADGICSGVLLREYLEENGIKVKKFLVPPLGLFDIDEEIEKELNKDTILFVCDINFSKEIFERLKKRAGFIINFDHHLKKENIKGIMHLRILSDKKPTIRDAMKIIELLVIMYSLFLTHLPNILGLPDLSTARPKNDEAVIIIKISMKPEIT